MIDRLLAAENLLKLVIYHRDNCNLSECTIMLSPLLEVYKQLVNRELTKFEKEQFL